ncbi:hypothetical protein QHH11_09915 [Aphanizomenon sp. PH219]|nr:hypothetical protein [Aphanizomenon sp. 202]MDK2459447.1 hypothetical protein [Aphanizomenon sp. PH219]
MRSTKLSILAISATLLIHPTIAKAQVEEISVNQQPTQIPTGVLNNASNLYTSPTNYPSPTTYPYSDITQQGGIINNNGTLGQINNCGRACINFYTDFSRNDYRFGANLSIPLFAPENEITSAQSKKTLYDVEMGYIKSIADACQAKDRIRVELSAKGLARIWNLDYKTLLHPSCG